MAPKINIRIQPDCAKSRLHGKIKIPCPVLPNFLKAMVILILALANYLLDIVSPRGPTMFGAGGKVLGFWIPRWSENAFSSLVPWTYRCTKAPNFMYYVPRFIQSPASLKRPTPFSVQLTVQISVTSNSTVLNSVAFFFEWHSGGHGSFYKNLERKTVS